MVIITGFFWLLGFIGSLFGYFAYGAIALITGALRNAARRYARLSAENLSSSDPRPPILFLRSFHDDQVQLEWNNRGAFRSVMAAGEPPPSLDHVLLDEATTLGPVVAIGVPGSPPPFGAVRVYTDDSEWQIVIGKIARDARAIVIVVDSTPGVNWEIMHIQDAGYLTKTLYLLPPRFVSMDESVRNVRRTLFSPNDGSEIVSDDVPIDQLTMPCIGWYQTSDGKIALLTSGKPTKASYVCALRLFLQHQGTVS